MMTVSKGTGVEYQYGDRDEAELKMGGSFQLHFGSQTSLKFVIF